MCCASHMQIIRNHPHLHTTNNITTPLLNLNRKRKQKTISLLLASFPLSHFFFPALLISSIIIWSRSNHSWVHDGYKHSTRDYTKVSIKNSIQSSTRQNLRSHMLNRATNCRPPLEKSKHIHKFFDTKCAIHILFCALFVYK